MNATTLRIAALTLAFAVKPAAAWLPSSALVLADTYPPIAGILVMVVLPGAIGIAGLHLVLLLPRFRSAPPTATSS